MEVNVDNAKRDKIEHVPWTFETKSYFVIWICGVIYSSYRVYLLGNGFQNSSLLPNLENGWPILHRKKDAADYEWKLWGWLIFRVLPPWMATHFMGATFVKSYLNDTCLSLWYVIVTSVCIVYNFGLTFCFMLITQPVVFTALIECQSCILIWLASFVMANSLVYFDIFWKISSNFDEITTIAVALFWIHLRCLSFSLSAVRGKQPRDSFAHYSGYTFYLPTFFLGPVILYEQFENSRKNERMNGSIFGVILRLAFQNCRYLFWYFLTEFLLHYVYVNSLQSFAKTFENQSVWIMYGMGYGMGQFFFNKYLVVYGLSLAWTRAEGYETPNQPKCVAYIHSYADMWRYFDQGLYIFLKRNIYEPLNSMVNFGTTPGKRLCERIFISSLCFSFIFIWHGLYYNVFVWAAMNFVTNVVEMAGREIGKSNFYVSFQIFLGCDNERRFRAFITAPLTILSAVSNFYFLGGSDVGDVYFNYIFKGSAENIACLWFFVYTLCQVSMQISGKIKFLDSLKISKKLGPSS